VKTEWDCLANDDGFVNGAQNGQIEWFVRTRRASRNRNDN
jgi:hypothetical protein